MTIIITIIIITHVVSYSSSHIVAAVVLPAVKEYNSRSLTRNTGYLKHHRLGPQSLTGNHHLYIPVKLGVCRSQSHQVASVVVYHLRRCILVVRLAGFQSERSSVFIWYGPNVAGGVRVVIGDSDGHHNPVFCVSCHFLLQIRRSCVCNIHNDCQCVGEML